MCKEIIIDVNLNLCLHRFVRTCELDPIDQSLLMYASMGNQKEVIRLLKEHGANVDHKSNTGSTALMLACDNDKIEAIEAVTALLEPPASAVDLQDNSGMSALMISCKQGYWNIVDLLLCHHARVDLQEENGKTALMFTCAHCDPASSKMFLERNSRSVNIVDNDSMSPLMRMSVAGKFEMVKLLLKYKAYPDLVNKEGRFVIYIIIPVLVRTTYVFMYHS